MKLSNILKRKFVEQPLAYWEEQSYMMVIPKEADENILKTATERLLRSKEFKIVDNNFEVNGVVNAKVLYEKEEYEVGFYLGGVSAPDYYLNKNFLFTEEEKKELLEATKALTIFMQFRKNAKKSYHLQLKLAMTMVPDLIGVLDESAEKMLPRNWVKLTVASKVLPSAKDLFNVQAIYEDDNSVWLHTHGLCRCGITELEILESSQEHYQQHYNLIVTYAMFLIDKDGEFEPRNNSAFIGRLINGDPVVATCVSWVDGLNEYKKLNLGGEKDRKDGHNTRTSIIFLYTSAENEHNGVLSKVSIYNELWGDNPLFFFSDDETDRMKALAMERFDYVKEAFKNKDNSVLIKIGLPLKEEGKFEHIWFELLEIKKDKFKAKLTQEPYDIPDVHTGYEDWYTLKDVTDWIIYTKAFAVNPNNVYLLEK